MNPLSPQTVLVVDDDPMLLDLLTCYIECAGCQAVTTTDGTEAVHLARSITPAMVLCDLFMPGFDGIDVVRLLRADSMTSGLPIVLMSGDSSPNLRGAKINAFLPKPFNMQAVERLVRTFTQTRKLSAAA